MAIIIPCKKSGTTPLKQPVTTTDRLIALVEQTIMDTPREFEGHLWAERPQPEWAKLLGVSVATLRRIISKPPFVRERVHASDGYHIPTTLIRVGAPDQKTPRHLANIMRNIYRKATGRVPSDAAWGMLKGCAEHWPEGHQVAIFKLVMNDWPTFIAWFWTAMDTGQIELGNKKVKHMKLHHPHIPTIRLGWQVALNLYEAHLQAKAS